MKRTMISIRIPDDLLKAVDEAAKEAFRNRTRQIEFIIHEWALRHIERKEQK